MSQTYNEHLSVTIDSEVSIHDVQTYNIEHLSVTIDSEVSIHDVQTYNIEHLSVSASLTITIKEIQNYAEHILTTINSEVRLLEYSSDKGICFRFETIESSSINRYLNLAIRGKQLSGAPNTFPLSIMISVNSPAPQLSLKGGPTTSSWYLVDPSEISFGLDSETIFWENILNKQFSSDEINSIKLMIIPRNDLDINGVAISEIRLFVVEPQYELFDVSLDLTDAKEYNVMKKVNYIKVYQST